MTHPDPKTELLERLSKKRAEHSRVELTDQPDRHDGPCCGECSAESLGWVDWPCPLSRALDCAIAAAEKHAAYEPGSNYCLGCYDPWPCPTLAAMTDAWEGAK